MIERRIRGWIQRAVILGLGIALAAPAPLRADDDDEDRDAKIAELDAKMEEYYAANKYDEAIDCARKILKLDPKDARTMYNLGCLHALDGDKDAAIESLEDAVENGFRDRAQFESDDDLQSLRGDARFKKLMARLGAPPARDEADDDEDDDDGEERDEPPAAERRSHDDDRDHDDDDDADDDDDEDEDEDDEDDDKRAERRDVERPARPPRPAASRGPSDEIRREVNRLTAEMIRTAEQGDNAKALKLAKKAHELWPDTWLTNYNMACMHSRLENTDEALDYFEKAVELGMHDVAKIEEDPDLDNIRKSKRFKAIVKSIRSGGAAAKSTTAWHVTLPADHDRDSAAPLIVALHGFGGNLRRGTEEWQDAADQVGAILLAVQGPIPRGDDRFEWGQSIEQINGVVLGAIDEVSKKYKIDRRRIAITGFSQGGWAAYHLALRNPGKFVGVIPVAGRFDSEARALVEEADLAGLRAYIMIGEDDRDLSSNKQAAKALKKAGAKVKLKEFDDTGHEYPKKRVKEQVSALKYVFGE